MMEKLKHFEVILESVQKIQSELDDLKGWINLQIYEVNQSERKEYHPDESEPDQNESYEVDTDTDRLDVDQIIKTEIVEDLYQQEEDDNFDENMFNMDHGHLVDDLHSNEPTGSKLNPLKRPRPRVSESQERDQDQDILPKILNGIYFSLYAREGNVVKAKCSTCEKIITGSIEFTSNFIKHLRKVHPSSMKAFEKDNNDEMIEAVAGSGQIKRRKDLQNTPSTTKSRQHYFELIPPTEKTLNPCKRCVMCKSNNIRKASRYFCQVCPDNPALCVVPCFKNWHCSNN